MRRRVIWHRRRIWLLAALGIVAVLLGGWRLWEHVRPPSAPRWKAQMWAGKKAHGVEDNPLHVEKHYRGALFEARKFGPADPRLAETLSSLADLYATQLSNRPEDWKHIVAAVWEARTVGPRTMCRRLEDSIFSLHAQHKRPHLAAMYREAVAVYDRAYPTDDYRLIRHYQMLAQRLQYFTPPPGDAVMAGTLYQRMLRIGEKQYGLDDPRLVPILENLARLHGENSNAAGVLHDRRRIFAITAASSGPFDDQAVARLEEWLTTCYTLCQTAEMEALLRQRQAEAERRCGRYDYRAFRELRLLANFYRRTGRHAEAEPLYRRTLAQAERHYRRSWRQMDEPFISERADLHGDRYAQQLWLLLDSYQYQLGAIGQTREAAALTRRLTD